MAHIEDYYVLDWKTSTSNGTKKFNVNHPKTLEHIEMWKEKYRKSGVSFKLKRVTVTTEIQEIEDYIHETKNSCDVIQIQEKVIKSI